MIFRATIPAGREPWIQVGDDSGILLHPLHLAHLPFQTIDAGVAGAIGKSATDPSNNEQNRKAERELVHIGLPRMNRRVGWRALVRTVWALCQQCLRPSFASAPQLSKPND